MKTTRRAAIPVVPVALLAIIVILGGAFGYYFITASGTISSQSSQISSQSAQISSQSFEIASQGTVISSQSAQVANQSTRITVQSAQISTQVAQIAADNSEIANLTTKVSSLKSQVVADQAEVASLTKAYAAANQTIVLQSSQITSLESQITNLNNEIAADSATISSLQAQATSLEGITGLSDSINEANGTYYTGSSGNISVVTFTANYAGYVAMSFTAASDPAHEGMAIDLAYGASVNSPTYTELTIPCCDYYYIVGYVPGTIVIPVTSGTVTVYFATGDSTSQSGTFTVYYYY